MSILKRIIVFLASISFSLLLLLLVSATVLRVLIGNGDHVKSWLQTSGIYDNFTSAILKQSANVASKSDDSIPLNDPNLIAIAEQSFSPQYLQQTTETIIDSIYVWLNGETYEPKFVIDISGPKQEFARLVGEYAVEQYEQLPACAADNIPTSVDPFSDRCKVSGLGSQKISSQIQEEIANNKDVFSQMSFTASSFSSQKNPGKSIFYDLAVLPKIFLVLRSTPYVIAALLVLSAVVLIFLDKSRQKGLRKIGVGLLVNGILILIFSFSSSILFDQIDRRLSADGGSSNAIIAEVINPLLGAINKDVVRISLAFGAVYVVVGVLLLITLFIYRRKKNRGNIMPDGYESPSTNNAITDDKQLPPDPLAINSDDRPAPTPQTQPMYRSPTLDNTRTPRATRKRSRQNLVQ